MDRKFIVPEKILIELLAAQMERCMLNCDGVDSWTWRKYIKREFIPSHVDHEGLNVEDYSFEDIAAMRIEGGEFEESR